MRTVPQSLKPRSVLRQLFEHCCQLFIVAKRIKHAGLIVEDDVISRHIGCADRQARHLVFVDLAGCRQSKVSR